ncbi:MAG: hypothetical protein P8009_09940 [Gammaproteobacteria bacterium]
MSETSPSTPGTNARAHVRVDRCVCKDISFAELLEMAQVLGPDIDLIALSTGASIDCGTCRPWLERALAERRDHFEIGPGDVADWEALAAHFARSD